MSSDNNVAATSTCPTTKAVQQENGFLIPTQLGGNTRELVLPMPTKSVSCKVTTNSTSGICQNKTPGHQLILQEAVHDRMANKPSCGM